MSKSKMVTIRDHSKGETETIIKDVQPFIVELISPGVKSPVSIHNCIMATEVGNSLCVKKSNGKVLSYKRIKDYMDWNIL